MKQQNPLESPPAEPDALVLKGCMCFGGNIGVGCQGCKRREEAVDMYKEENPDEPVVDAAKGEAVCGSCGRTFLTREGTGNAGKGQCAGCHEF
jgi:hypothetical protein